MSMMRTKPNQSKPNSTQFSSAGRDMGQVHGAEWLPPPPPVGPTPWLCCSNPLWVMVPEPSHPSALNSPVEGTMGACRGGGEGCLPLCCFVCRTGDRAEFLSPGFLPTFCHRCLISRPPVPRCSVLGVTSPTRPRQQKVSFSLGQL